MNPLTKPSITLLRVPFDWGASRRGASHGPEAILQAGLAQKLERLGYELETPAALSATTPARAGGESASAGAIRHLDAVVQINEALARAVAAVERRGSFPLILGGDHSLAIGTIAGLTERPKKLGLLWFDAHSDLNTPDTSPSGNAHGMSLAAGLGLGDSRLAKLLGRAPKLAPEHVVIIGARDLDAGEKLRIRELGVRCFTMHDIDRLGIAAVMAEAIRRMEGTDAVHVSFDIDSVDPIEAPGTGTPVRGGLNYREAHFALELLQEAGIVTSAELVEVNPALDTDDARTVRLAVDLLCTLLGETIL